MPEAHVSPVHVPALEGERVRLRGHALADFDACAAMWGDPNVTRFIGGRPSTPDEVWSRLLRYNGHWSLLGYGFWVIEDKANGQFLGEIGFADFKRGLRRDFSDHPEMGWSLATAAHGKGIATEAARLVLNWGDAHLPAPFVCMIAPENAPSIRVAEKIGFKEFAREDFRGAPSILFRRGG